MPDAGDHRFAAFLKSGVEPKTKNANDALGMQRGNERRQIGGALERAQCGRDPPSAAPALWRRSPSRPCSSRSSRRSCVSSASAARLRRRLEDVAQHGVVALLQLVEPAVARLVAGQRVALDPPAARELIEVGAGVGGLVERRRARCPTGWPARRLALRAHVGAHRDDADKQWDENEDEQFSVHPSIIARCARGSIPGDGTHLV